MTTLLYMHAARGFPFVRNHSGAQLQQIRESHVSHILTTFFCDAHWTHEQRTASIKVFLPAMTGLWAKHSITQHM